MCILQLLQQCIKFLVCLASLVGSELQSSCTAHETDSVVRLLLFVACHSRS
jgi:hypothetical protein